LSRAGPRPEPSVGTAKAVDGRSRRGASRAPGAFAARRRSVHRLLVGVRARHCRDRRLARERL